MWYIFGITLATLVKEERHYETKSNADDSFLSDCVGMGATGLQRGHGE
jgi:hypothetical protein